MNNLFTELKRRNIFRVAGVYAVVGWILAQASAVLENAMNLPAWFDTLVVSLLLIGFPIAVLLAWAFEMTPEGVKRTESVVDGDSITSKTGRKLDYTIIVGLVLVGALVVGSRFMPQKIAAPEITQQTQTSETDKVVEEASIAVLPFADLSPNGDQAYFSDGIAEEILNVLVRVDNLKVASRTSAFGFKGQEALGIPTIAKRLKVRHVLEGSVRKSGEMVRITAQLIDARTDQHLWSQTYDRKLTAENIFAIQDEIANEIVKQLGIVMDGGGSGSPIVSVKADTENLNAYELYLQAHNKFLARNDLKGTMTLFEQAVAADPGFARAYAGLAGVYVIAPGWGMIDKDYSTLAAQTAQKAIALDPELALPYAVLGLVATKETPANYTEGFKQFNKAISLNSKETTAWLWRGIIYTHVGYFDEAEQDFLRCLDIDPAYEMCRRFMALTKFYVGDIDRALALFEQGRLKKTKVNDWQFSYAYAAKGDYATVAATVFYNNQNTKTIPLIELSYRAITDPDFDFTKERPVIEAAIEHETGVPVNWEAPESGGYAFLFGNYAAVKISDIDGQIWWQPYPMALKTSPHRKRWMIEAGLPEFWREHGFPPQCKAVGQDDFECD